MPLTIVYGTLATCADAFLFFSQHLGKEQYFPTGADHISKNRLFAQFHAEYPQHEKDWMEKNKSLNSGLINRQEQLMLK